MGWFVWAWRNKGTVGFLVIVTALAYYAYLAKSRGIENDELSEQVRGYKSVMADMRDWHEETVRVLEKQRAEAIERLEFETQLRADIKNDEDGPLAPVLRNTLDKLQRRNAGIKENVP